MRWQKQESERIELSEELKFKQGSAFISPIVVDVATQLATNSVLSQYMLRI